MLNRDGVNFLGKKATEDKNFAVNLPKYKFTISFFTQKRLSFKDSIYAKFIDNLCENCINNKNDLVMVELYENSENRNK